MNNVPHKTEFEKSKNNKVTISDQRRFKRVEINLLGRLMLPNRQEYECQILEMSPGNAFFQTIAKPQPGDRIIAYANHIGRIEGKVARIDNNGFAVTFTATSHKRDKLAAKLTWLANRNELGMEDDRRHDRVIPEHSKTIIHFEDGRKYECQVIDVSLSGAAVSLDVKPDIGTIVRLGQSRASVVRHFPEGIALEYEKYTPEIVTEEE